MKVARTLHTALSNFREQPLRHTRIGRIGDIRPRSPEVRSYRCKGWAHPRLGVIAIAALSVTACAYPYVNYSRSEIIKAGQSVNDPAITDIESARWLINGLAETLHKAGNDRQIGHTVLAEVMFYGSLVAAYGIAAEQIGARNTGAGLAGIAAALDSHYSLATQLQAINSASSRADCLQDAINGIDPATLVLFDENSYVGDLGSEDANKALQAIPDETLGAVEEISVQLKNDLNSVNLTVSSLKDVQDIAEKFTKDAKAAAAAHADPSKSTEAILKDAEKLASPLMAAGLATPTSEQIAKIADAKERAAMEIQRKTTFLQRVLKFSSASQACIKLTLKA